MSPLPEGHNDLTNLIAALALAAIIAGEAPAGCPVEAKLAVAHVYQRNDVWFGNAQPTNLDLWVALNWQRYPDPTNGAVYLIHPTDRVRMPWLRERTAQWVCDGTALEAWR